MESSCRFSVYIDAFVHGELEEDQKAMFENHLPSCVICATEVAAMRKLKDSLADAHSVRLDETFNYAVVNSIRDPSHYRPAKEITIALEDIVISLATMLAIVLIVIQLFSAPKVSSTDMVGTLTNIERSSMEQTNLSKDQVLELVMRSK